jgi:hypothetical protein
MPLQDRYDHMAEGAYPYVVAGPRKLGALSGQFQVPDDFSDEDEEVNRLFYGDKS